MRSCARRSGLWARVLFEDFLDLMAIEDGIVGQTGSNDEQRYHQLPLVVLAGLPTTTNGAHS